MPILLCSRSHADLVVLSPDNRETRPYESREGKKYGQFLHIFLKKTCVFLCIQLHVSYLGILLQMSHSC